MQVDFYHLTRSPLERVLPSICEKVLAGGGRLLIVAEAPVLARLDEQLWTHSADAFLPHARAGAAADAEQPILLSESPEASNGAANIALSDGRWREEALTFGRRQPVRRCPARHHDPAGDFCSSAGAAAFGVLSRSTRVGGVPRRRSRSLSAAARC